MLCLDVLLLETSFDEGSLMAFVVARAGLHEQNKDIWAGMLTIPWDLEC
jgi:hypothetical protein